MHYGSVVRALSSVINVIFGITTTIVGIVFLSVFFEVFEGFLSISQPTILNTLGIAFFTSGYLYIAAPVLATGVLYVWVGIKNYNKSSHLSVFMAAMAIVIPLFFVLNSAAIDLKEDQRQEIELKKQNQKNITSAAITDSNSSELKITYNFPEGTAGNYLIQTEVVTDGQSEPLYFDSFQQTLSTTDLSLSKSISYSELFASCQNQSNDWICVGLLNPSASLENIRMNVKVRMILIADQSSGEYAAHSENILIPDAEFSFALSPESSIDNVQVH
ncbi:MAG: hypothetical protein WDZ94_00415 [Patescibacteria group bacterium]